MVTFSEISPSEFPSMYKGGMSINEIAYKAERSYTHIRNNLISSHTPLRRKEDAVRQYIRNHPEWSRQFVKYAVHKTDAVTEEKILVLAMIITEGYADRTSVGFTNIQPLLHSNFRSLVEKVYGPIRFGTNKITTRFSSVDVAQDITNGMPKKAFSESIFTTILASKDLTRRVLRIVADTEGSMIISIRKAPRNYTVECRAVMASKNRAFSEQIASMLSSIGIDSHIGSVGVTVMAKAQIRKFIDLVDFSPGVKVIRKRVELSSWYGKEKSILSKLCLDIYRRQEIARASGHRGCFELCRTRADTMSYLTRWYDGLSGGE